MSPMTRIERVTAVINREPPDRPPISFWHHFGPGERAGRPAVDAHLKHLQTHDLDFLKVFFDLGYPHDTEIGGVADLRGLPVLSGDEGVFGQHLEVLRTLAAELGGRVLLTTTVFNAWATLRGLLRTGSHVSGAGPSKPDAPATLRMSRFMAEDRAVMSEALRTIGASLANFAGRCLQAGADGVFLSVRDDWVDTPEIGVGTYDELVRPSDLDILAAAEAAVLNVLHVCGAAVNFAAFADYPVHVLNWADRTAGPPLADVAHSLGPTPCGGIDQLGTLVSGTPEECATEAKNAVAECGDRPIVIAPGCTYDPNRVPHANLAAIRGIQNEE